MPTFKATQQPTVGTAKLLRSKVLEFASAQRTLDPKRTRGQRGQDMIHSYTAQYRTYKTERIVRIVIRWKKNWSDMSLCWRQIRKLGTCICDIIHAQSHTMPAQVRWGSFCLRRFSWCLLPLSHSKPDGSQWAHKRPNNAPCLSLVTTHVHKRCFSASAWHWHAKVLQNFAIFVAKAGAATGNKEDFFLSGEFSDCLSLQRWTWRVSPSRSAKQINVCPKWSNNLHLKSNKTEEM